MNRFPKSHANSLTALAQAHLEIGDIDVALLVAVDHDNLEAGEHGRRRVGAVRRRRNEANVAVLLGARRVVGANDEQTGVLRRTDGEDDEGKGRRGLKSRDSDQT